MKNTLKETKIAVKREKSKTNQKYRKKSEIQRKKHWKTSISIEIFQKFLILKGNFAKF